MEAIPDETSIPAAPVTLRRRPGLPIFTTGGTGRGPAMHAGSHARAVIDRRIPVWEN